jgi:transposase
MPPPYVKPCVRTNKHDAADAEGARHAVPRGPDRALSFGRSPEEAGEDRAAAGDPDGAVRDQLIGRRGLKQRRARQPTAGTSNARRGHLAELGIVAAERQAGGRELLAARGDLEDGRIPPLAREVLQVLVAQLRSSRPRSPSARAG